LNALKHPFTTNLFYLFHSSGKASNSADNTPSARNRNAVGSAGSSSGNSTPSLLDDSDMMEPSPSAQQVAPTAEADTARVLQFDDEQDVEIIE